MMQDWSEGQKKAWKRFWSSELGERGLEMIKQIKSNHVDTAIVYLRKDKDKSHDELVRAEEAESILQILTPEKSPEPKHEED